MITPRARRGRFSPPLLLAAAAIWLSATPAWSGAAAEGPSVELDRASGRPGEKVIVTLDGFDSRVVTLSVCGNLAARGSADCNMIASEGLGVNRDGSNTLAELPLSAPPRPCPCVVRASTTGQDEVAIARIELVGHPVAPVVQPISSTPLDVLITARKAPRGVVEVLRSSLGGPTPYEVTITVTNTSLAAVDGVVLTASAGRSTSDDAASIEVPRLERLEAGEVWERTVHATLDAPVVGRHVFQATASTGGATVRAHEVQRSTPAALVVAGLVLAIDLAAIVWRRATRRRGRMTAPMAAPQPA